MHVYLSDIDTCIPFSQGMSVSELGDYGDGVETCVFGQGCRYYFERISICLEAVGLHAFERLGMLREQTRDVDLWSSPTANQCSDPD